MPLYDKSFFDKDSAKNPNETLDNLVSLKECIVDITAHAIAEFAARKVSQSELDERLKDLVGTQESCEDDICPDAEDEQTSSAEHKNSAETEEGSCLDLEDGSCHDLEDGASCEDECASECGLSMEARASAIRETLGQTRLIAHQMLQDWLLVDGSDADMPIFAKDELANGLNHNLFMELFVLPEAFVQMVTKNMYSIVNGLNYLAHELIYLAQDRYGSDEAIVAAGIDLDDLRDCAVMLNNFEESSTSDLSALSLSDLCFDASEYLDCAANSLRILGKVALILRNGA